jgi:choline dehydrogenase-like flavoprotein
MVDYIIIGGGSAGCVLAARLSETEASVLLLEAGPRDTDKYIHMPVGFAFMTGGPLTWGYETAPLRHANNRTAVYPQARVLGGGSSINAEIYTRGCPEDYDAWATEYGCKGWAAKDLQPYFLKSEGNTRLGGKDHGIDGPLAVSDVPPNVVSRAYVQGCMEVGMPFNADFNSGKQEGAGFYQTTTKNGRRCSAAVGYLRPVMHRKNLTVKTNIFVNRILINKGRATGVEVIEGGQVRQISAAREVILTAGAIGSPKLLMLSGIGPAGHLRDVGINVQHDLPGVGQNFHDHFSTDVTWVLNGPHSYDKYKKLHWKVMAGIEYYAFGSGPVASNIVEAGAFWWGNRAQEKTPDLQFHFLAGAGVEKGVGDVPGGNGATCNAYFNRPRSRGSVTLRSSNPVDAPIVDPNSFAEPYDLERHIEAIKITQAVGQTRAMRKYVASEYFPGEACKTKKDYIELSRASARSSYHPVGTCKMGGARDEMAVVDLQCRLHGVEALRVCDSSIMPRIVSSNTNAPTIAMAEKAADLIRGNQ